MNPASLGESQIDPQTMQAIAPDIAGQQGQQQLFQHAVSANVAKRQLDGIMQALAEHLHASMSSRVKNIETAGKKIAQKRLQGRSYGIEDVNDMLGSRLVVKNKGEIPKARSAIEKLSQAGIFAILKKQQVKQGTYEAYHFDIRMSNGVKAEIQIHTPQSEAEAVSNHSLRSLHGEDPVNEAVSLLRNKQAMVAKSLPNDAAQAVSSAIQQMSQQQGGQVSPLQSAHMLAAASQQ